MNVVRKLLESNYDEVKDILDKTYYSIEYFQKNRSEIKAKENMHSCILRAVEVLEVFKPYIPAYKQKYFDIVKSYKELNMTSTDLIMAFDRMVYELHSRLERNLCSSEELQAWSPLMKEILDGRRMIPEKNKNINSNEALEFIASGLSVVGGYVKSDIKVIEGSKDFDRVKSGNIIVSKMTTPDIIMIINKISGIATEQGGRLCHAAVIAREYNIPCIVGCGKLINAIKDEETLILDAHNGIVFR